MSKRTHTRRRFLSLSLGIGTSGLFFLQACNSTREKQEMEAAAKEGANPCEDVSELTQADLDARQKMGYVKSTPLPASTCSNCQLWLPVKDRPTCGKCQLFKGPVYAQGYCTYWAPQVQGDP